MDYDLSKLMEIERISKELLESCKYLESPDYQSIEKISENITKLRERVEEQICVREHFGLSKDPNDFKRRYTSFMINGLADKKN